MNTLLLHIMAVVLPGTLIAILVGRAVNDRLSGEGFLRYVYVVLIGVGAVLVGQVVGI